MKAGTSEEAVKAGTGTRTNASVVYNGYKQLISIGIQGLSGLP